MWNLDVICAAAAGALRDEADRLDLEQSPYGIDSRDELALHPVIRAGLRAAGLGAHPEQRYPGHRARLRRSEGDRCDLVLTHDPDEHLLDPLASGTLFGARGVDSCEALWLEIKAVHQFAIIDGVAGANRGYSGQLLGPAMADVRKLGADEAILHGAIMLVLFTASADVAFHDLGAWLHRCLDKDLNISSPSVERFAVTDRIGNSACTVAICRVGRR